MLLCPGDTDPSSTGWENGQDCTNSLCVWCVPEHVLSLVKTRDCAPWFSSRQQGETHGSHHGEH